MQPGPHQLTTDQWDLSGHRVFIISRPVWLEVMSRRMLLTCSSVLCIRMRSISYCTFFWSQVEASKEAEKTTMEEKWPRPQSMKTKPHVQYCSWCLSHGQAKAGHFRPLDQQTIVAEGVLKAVFACDNFFPYCQCFFGPLYTWCHCSTGWSRSIKRVWRESISRVKTSNKDHCRVDGACDRSSNPNLVQGLQISNVLCLQMMGRPTILYITVLYMVYCTVMQLCLHYSTCATFLPLAMWTTGWSSWT